MVDEGHDLVPRGAAMDHIEIMPFSRRLEMQKRGAWVWGAILAVMVVMGSGEANARGGWSVRRQRKLAVREATPNGPGRKPEPSSTQGG